MENPPDNKAASVLTPLISIDAVWLYPQGAEDRKTVVFSTVWRRFPLCVLMQVMIYLLCEFLKQVVTSVYSGVLRWLSPAKSCLALSEGTLQELPGYKHNSAPQTRNIFFLQMWHFLTGFNGSNLMVENLWHKKCGNFQL